MASALPWAVNPGDFPRHPTQLYLALNGLILFFVINSLSGNPRFSGRLFPFFLLLYGVGRFSVDFLRESERYLFGLTATQLLIPPVMLVAGLFLMKANRRQPG
jgi:phosphatidylglycerol:prolipoprotein diacylglycerol transferase